MKIDTIDLYQYKDKQLGYYQTIWIFRGEKCRSYHAKNGNHNRFARSLRLVMAFAERAEAEMNHA